MLSICLMKQLWDQGVYIFGAGKRGTEICSLLETWGVHVIAYIDNSIEKQGQIISDKKCLDIECLVLQGGEECSIVVSPLENQEIIEQLKSLNFRHIYDGSEILRERYWIPVKGEKEDYRNVAPFNHYESPYPDMKEIHEKENEIFDYQRKVLDIDFNIVRQLELAKRMGETDIINWGENKQEGYRYFYGNSWFGKGSADVLYYMLRILKPGKIIEVGSGFSTAVMLDTNNMHFENSIEIHSIEPNTERLKSLLKENDNLTIYESKLQDIPLDFFEQLKENDILFIDSSHVSKINSDVNYTLFEIFPRLSQGVYIHFHDMFYPFIYPKSWIYKGLAYNEMYLLRAFLMNNHKYSIQFFGEMLLREYQDQLPGKLREIGGSLWIRKN